MSADDRNIPHSDFTGMNTQWEVELDKLCTEWQVSTSAKSVCRKFFLKMWPRERVINNLIFTNDAPQVEKLKAFGSIWLVSYDDNTSRLMSEPYLGLSFRVLPNDEHVVVIKAWENKDKKEATK